MIRHFLRAALRELGPNTFWSEIIGGAIAVGCIGLVLLGAAAMLP